MRRFVALLGGVLLVVAGAAGCVTKAVPVGDSLSPAPGTGRYASPNDFCALLDLGAIAPAFPYHDTPAADHLNAPSGFVQCAVTVGPAGATAADLDQLAALTLDLTVGAVGTTTAQSEYEFDKPTIGVSATAVPGLWQGAYTYSGASGVVNFNAYDGNAYLKINLGAFSPHFTMPPQIVAVLSGLAWSVFLHLPPAS
jgi:hypothetical protein